MAFALISVNDSSCVTYKLDSTVIIFFLNSLSFIIATGLRLVRFPVLFKSLAGRGRFETARRQFCSYCHKNRLTAIDGQS